MTGLNVRNIVRHTLIIAITSVLITMLTANIGDGGSKCADATCTPAPVGVQCDPRYERDDGCCPVWYCSNGQTAYGISRSSSIASGNSFSFSSSSNGGGMKFPSMNSNPFGGLASLFGGLFGR